MLEVNQKCIQIMGLFLCWFGCWNQLLIEQNQKVFPTEHFKCSSVRENVIFHDENKRAKNQLHYFHLPITSVTLLLIQ